MEMLRQCKKAGLPEPEFVSVRNLEFQTIIARDVYTDVALANMGLNERQLTAVKYVKEKGRISNKIYQEINKISKATATRELAKLVEVRLFTQKGVVGQGTTYVLKPIGS